MNSRIGCFFLSVALFVTAQQNASGQWVQTNAPDGGVVNCFGASGGNLFVGSNGGIFISKDSGTTWRAVDSGLSSDPYVNALAISAVDPIAGNDSFPLIFINLENSDDTNVFLSTNNGTRWNAKTIFYTSFDTVQNTIDTVVDAPDVNVLVVRGSKLYAGTEENGGFFLSTDSGITWMARSNGLPLQSNVTAIMAIGNEIFVGIPGNGVYRSINNGTSWASASTGLIADVTDFAVIGSTFFAATDEGIFSSFDGASWSATNSGLTDRNVLTLAVCNGNGSSPILCAGTEDSGIFLSTNGGATWMAVNAGLPPNTIVNSFAIIGGNTSSPLLFAAADGGIWMRPISEMVLPNTLVSLSDSLVFGNIVIGKDSTLPCSVKNSGNTAITITSIDFVPAGEAFTLDGFTLPVILQPGDTVTFDVTFAPTVLGAQFDTLVILSLKIPLSGVGIENADVAGAIVSAESLQCYPNPFSQSTTIQVTTTKQGPVQVGVVNVLGEQVALLFDGALDAGEHSFVWDAKDALAGTYFCEIRSGAGTRQQAAIVFAR